MRMRQVDPLSNRQKEQKYGCKIEYLTVEEIINRYGTFVAEDKLKQLESLLKDSPNKDSSKTNTKSDGSNLPT